MELMQALALVSLARGGWVEPLRAPDHPINLLAQQLLARVLAEGRVGRSDWPGPLGRVVTLAALDRGAPESVLDSMISRSVLVEDAGLVSIGSTGESEYGRRNFMDVTSLFLTEPLLAVRWGQRELGSVDPSSLASRDEGRPTLLLGGHAWGVRDVDWERRLVWVEPANEPGRSRWSGGGAALSIEVCHAIRDALAGPADLADAMTKRAAAKLEELRVEHYWIRAGRTTLVRDDERNRARWWTFGGARANRAIAGTLDAAGVPTMSVDDLGIGIRTRPPASEIRGASWGATSFTPPTDPRRRTAVKFGSCLADVDIDRMLAARDRDAAGLEAILGEPLDTAS
jgi:ATP-dependent Lhr-like helicase